MIRNINYEIVRARTLKSSWIFPVIGIALCWMLAYFGMNDVVPNYSAEGELIFPSFVTAVNNSYSPLSIFFITIGFAQAFGHEYRDGTMRLTLSAFPVRTRVLVSKFLIPAIFSAASALIAIAGIWAIYATQIPQTDYSNALLAVGRHTLFTIIWGLLVASVVIFTRIMAAGIAGLVVWAAILESLVGAVLSSKFPKLPDYLPLNAGMTWAANGNTRDFAVLAVASTLVVGLASIKFLTRDA